MKYATLDDNSHPAELIGHQIDRRVLVGSIFGIVLAAMTALSIGGNALVPMIGALLLGIVGLLAAAL